MLFEAADIDGATRWAKVRHITLPLLNPQIVMVSIIEIIFAAQTFDQVYALTHGGPINASRVIIVYFYQTAFEWYHFGQASGIAVLVVVVLAALSFFQWRFVRKATEF